MRVYNYIFFKLYQILSVFDESPSFATIIVMCWLFMFNSFTLLYIVSKSFDVTNLLDKYVSIPGGILLFGGHLFYYYHKRRHVKVIEKFKGESKRSSIVGIIGAFLYIFLTVWIFFKYAAPNMGGMLK